MNDLHSLDASAVLEGEQILLHDDWRDPEWTTVLRKWTEYLPEEIDLEEKQVVCFETHRGVWTFNPYEPVLVALQ